MTDNVLDLTDPLDVAPGDAVRLSERLKKVLPSATVAALDAGKPLTTQHMTPAAKAGLAHAQVLAARAARQAREQRSLASKAINGFVALCSFIPYALVALALRLVMARVFFLDGQGKVDGLRVPVNVQDFDFSFVLPMQVKADTITAFLTRYAAVPVPPVLGAYLVSYAEFLLPVMLALGLGARFAALGLLVITAMIQLYVMPDALWTTHVYWIAILTTLLALGPGQISVDRVIRFIARRGAAR